MKSTWKHVLNQEKMYDGKTYGNLIHEKAIIFYYNFDLRGQTRSQRQPTLQLREVTKAQIGEQIFAKGSKLKELALVEGYFVANWV